MLDQEETSGRKFRIYPVTRIQGRADIEVLFTQHLEAGGARFRALEFRGFEHLAAGVPAFRVPRIMSRICGSCGPYHQLAACIAVEDAAGCEVPPAAGAFRELLSWLWLASNHLLTMTYMALPDYALPMSDVAVRNVTGVYKVEQEAVGRLTSVRAAFLQAQEILSGPVVHPPVIVPGGTSFLPDAGAIERTASALDGCEDDLREILRLVTMLVGRGSRMMDPGSPMIGHYMAVTSGGRPSLLGDEVVLAPFGEGESISMDHNEFSRVTEEEPVPWSYLVPVKVGGKEPILVGPLARVNIGFGPDTPWADLEYRRCREQWGHPLDKEFLSFMAMALELIWAWERARLLLETESLAGGEACRVPTLSKSKGVAALDSPAGTLQHRVVLDADGVVSEYRVVSPLQFNHLLMNWCLTRVARKVVQGFDITDPVAQALERTVRAFNPCVPCGTH